MVKMKRRRANAAGLQLEQERMAAAEKTMGMILRLQNEIGRSIEYGSNFKRWKEDFEFVLGMADIDQPLHEDEPPSLTDSSTTAEKEFYAKFRSQVEERYLESNKVETGDLMNKLAGMREEEYFKRDDTDATSPSTEELVKAFSIDRYLDGPVVINGTVGGGSGATVGANDAPLTVFKANHYKYDHTDYTDFASPSECSACKCQDCRAKYDVVINAINALTASVKELTSKRGLIPSKRILFPSTPLEIRAKKRRRVISRALSGIQKSKIATLLSVCCIEQCTMYKGEQYELKKKLGGCDYFDWYEERHPSQANRVIWGLLNKVKASEEKQNRARRYYIVVVIATGLVLLGTWILKPNC
ncbi:hypothetical protein T459_21614 [Capsicum annuum]|uniref:GTD-binding domain-containing protein n=1 Tax=Capsicum annuum TaxID=4072 RepID=A0A2G2YX50_CAPAN|nr:hypothetical protein T459_21614 [Capsicum annuum]